jgi:hypothetical protein
MASTRATPPADVIAWPRIRAPAAAGPDACSRPHPSASRRKRRPRLGPCAPGSAGLRFHPERFRRFLYRVISTARIGRAGGHGRKLAGRRKHSTRLGIQKLGFAGTVILGGGGGRVAGSHLARRTRLCCFTPGSAARPRRQTSLLRHRWSSRPRWAGGPSQLVPIDRLFGQLPERSLRLAKR